MSGVTPTYHKPETGAYSTHPKVVAGIVLIASLMLFSVVFWAVMGISWAVSPPADTIIGTVRLEATTSDYFATGRVVTAVIVGVILTWGFWKVAEGESR